MNSKLKKAVTLAVSVGCVAGIGGIGYKVYDEYFRVVEVSAISVANTTYDLVIGDTGVNVPSIEVLPNDATESKEVVWTSSNEGIATVDNNGIITAKGVGDCKIVCSLVEDSTIRAEVQLNVAPILVSKIVVSDTFKIKEEEKKTLEVKTNDDATDKTLNFKSSDESIATVNAKGEVKGIKEGECEITITSKDGNATKTVKIQVENKWGMKSIDKRTVYSTGGNLRVSPGTKYDKIEYLDVNTEITITAENDGWYACEVNGTKGYIGKTVVQDSKVVIEQPKQEQSYDYSYDDSSDYSYNDGGSDYSYSDSGSSSSGGSDYSYSDSGSSSSSSSSGGGSSLLAGLEVENAGDRGGSNEGGTDDTLANAFPGITIY